MVVLGLLSLRLSVAPFGELLRQRGPRIQPWPVALGTIGLLPRSNFLELIGASWGEGVCR